MFKRLLDRLLTNVSYREFTYGMIAVSHVWKNIRVYLLPSTGSWMLLLVKGEPVELYEPEEAENGTDNRTDEDPAA
jgi:hypothetical protein